MKSILSQVNNLVSILSGINQCMLTILYVMFQLSRDSTWCQASTPWKLCTISWRWRNLTISWRGPPLASLWPPFLHPHTVTLHWPHHTSPSQEHREVYHCSLYYLCIEFMNSMLQCKSCDSKHNSWIVLKYFKTSGNHISLRVLI